MERTNFALGSRVMLRDGRKGTILFEHSGPVASAFESGASVRQNVYDKKGKLVKEDKAVEFVGRSGMLLVRLDPQHPGHNPSDQLINASKLVKVESRERSLA